MTARPNPFENAQRQLDEAAAMLGLSPAMHAFLRNPMREYHFTVPLEMDDGSWQVFQGFRIQYNDARGPAKGGIRKPGYDGVARLNRRRLATRRRSRHYEHHAGVDQGTNA